MTKSLEGPLRAFLASVLGGFVANGIMTEDQMMAIIQMVVGLLGIIGIIVWSYVSNQIEALIRRIVESRRVKLVVTTPEIAASEASPKVVTVAPGQERNLRDAVVNPNPIDKLRPPT